MRHGYDIGYGRDTLGTDMDMDMDMAHGYGHWRQLALDSAGRTDGLACFDLAFWRHGRCR